MFIQIKGVRNKHDFKVRTEKDGKNQKKVDVFYWCKSDNYSGFTFAPKLLLYWKHVWQLSRLN